MGHEVIEWCARYLESLDEVPVRPDVAPGWVRAQLPASAPSTPDAVGRGARRPRSHRAARHHALAVAAVPRLLPRQLEPRRGARRAGGCRARPAGDAVGHLAGGHRARAARLRLAGRAARPAGGVPSRFGPGWRRHPGRGLDRHVRRRRGRARRGHRVAIRTDCRGCARTRPSMRTRRSRRRSASPAWARRSSGWSTSTTQRRMRVDALSAAIEADLAAGAEPFLVTSTVGTTSFMAVDPVADAGAIARRHGLWHHVDAAMAGSAGVAPELRPLVADGLDTADSYCFDPHKWLLAGMDCDVLYVADRARAHGRHVAWCPSTSATPPPTVGEVVDLPRLGRRPRSPVPRPEAVVRPAHLRGRGAAGARPPRGRPGDRPGGANRSAPSHRARRPRVAVPGVRRAPRRRRRPPSDCSTP